MANDKQPSAKTRSIFLGSTGTGKTVRACHVMAYQNWHLMPWVIIDAKLDELIVDICKDNNIPDIKPTDAVPMRPGIYHMPYSPKRDKGALEDFLWRVHARGNCGLYIDEGYMVDNDAFDTILVQGRSLKIPVIALYQRPVWMSRFAIAQADFFCAHFQNDERDLKTTREFIPPMKLSNNELFPIGTPLQKYCGTWYTVGDRYSRVIKPSPTPDEIRALFIDRFQQNKKLRLL